MYMYVSLSYTCKTHIFLRLTERNMAKEEISKGQVSKLNPGTPHAQKKKRGEGVNS